MKSKSVSKTALEMNLSQPALSHALQRLRNNLKDPLLIKTSRQLVPTPYALEIIPSVDEILANIENLFTQTTFDPKKIEGIVRIKTTDYFEQLMLSKLLTKLDKEAPNVKLISVSTQGLLPQLELEQGKCDIAIAGFFGELPQRFYQQKLFNDELVGLCRKNHPQIKNELSLKKYLEVEHLFISPEGQIDGGLIDQILKKKKLKRNIKATVSGFMTPAWVCSETDLVCTLPKKLATLFKSYLPLTEYELPFEVPKIQIVQVWHERTHRDPLLKYVRSLIFDACTAI